MTTPFKASALSPEMSQQIKDWHDDAVRRGVDGQVAYLGTEIIAGWKQYWGYEISAPDREKMTVFALSFPEAALHRWSTIGGPRPWLVHESVLEELQQNPRFSMVDVLKKQGISVRTRKPKSAGKNGP